MLGQTALGEYDESYTALFPIESRYRQERVLRWDMMIECVRERRLSTCIHGCVLARMSQQ